jgi:hypothetical protein
VLASVLKPVDDTRMLEKIGATLADSSLFEVSIIGYPTIGSTAYSSIKFYPLNAFKRLSFKRLVAPWIVFKKVNQVKPEVIIINTPELLLVAILNRIFFGRKIIYDVLENYALNIRFTPTFPRLFRPVIAMMVRFIEILSSPFIHRFVLAEKGYSVELSFARHPIVLQNKLPKSIALKYSRKQSNGNSRLVFSGTLAESTGVFEAIKLGKRLHAVDASYSLTIIGYCSLPEVLNLIKEEIKDTPFITLIGGDTLVPHEEILAEISCADMGIIIYPPNPSTKSSIPTKLFEYLAIQLPVLIRHNSESHELVRECRAGIVLTEVPDFITLSKTIKNQPLMLTPPDIVFWESEAENLINSLKL